jgi:hypothetical protein
MSGLQPRHVLATQFFSALRTYPGPLPNSNKDYRTCPARPFFAAVKSPIRHVRLANRVILNLTGHIWSRYRTCPVPKLGSRDGFSTCPTPDIGHVRFSDTPTSRFLLGAIKGPPHPQLGWPLSSLEYNLNQSFLSSKPLSHSQASLQYKLPKRDLSHSLEWRTQP